MKPLTLDELAEEVRLGRTPPFAAWEQARAYERSLFSPDTHWPVEGEIYECVTPCRVKFISHWNVAFTSGGDVPMVPGEQIRIQEVFHPQPVIVAAVPLAYADIQERAIPAADRQHPHYAGYSLSVRTEELVGYFRLHR